MSSQQSSFGLYSVRLILFATAFRIGRIEVTNNIVRGRIMNMKTINDEAQRLYARADRSILSLFPRTTVVPGFILIVLLTMIATARQSQSPPARARLLSSVAPLTQAV